MFLILTRWAFLVYIYIYLWKIKTCSLLLGVSRPWTIFRQLIRKFSFGYTYEECLCHGMRGRCHHGFMLQILCLFLWRHLENISALLLRRCFLSAFIIHSFSSRQRLHRFAPLLYALARFKMDHFTENWWAPFFSFQM